ncbi:hypothetical protein AGMMS49545_04130 [Betaproteobacteria bacterium]|nr:hypothetical protein AGMMS49545_04130 [Betaproteobacteria bacterium]GHU43083.1 hypothetical protein AGMMS50289_08900 [Betaproteobacteria bacterium]
MTDKPYCVELTTSLLERLDVIEAFLQEVDAAFAFDTLLSELQTIVIPNLRRFPRIGRRFLDNLPQSIETLDRVAALPSGTSETIREYLHGDYLMLYAVVDTEAKVYLLSIRHHRQLSFNFERFWSGA